MSIEEDRTPSAREAAISRRRFLAASGGILAAGCTRRFPNYSGGLVGADVEVGHRVRDGGLTRATREERVGIAIVGAGIAGLSAAYRLSRRGLRDFVVLEMDRSAGGNSRSGSNSVAAYPWGAHYVPLPGAEATEVLDVFRDFGVIEGSDPQGLPIYRDEYLCHDPMERLFIHGRWQEGILPQHGLTVGERDEIDAFLAEMEQLKRVRGRDGRPVFAIPVDRSSRDPEWLELDSLTMAQWMDGNGYRGPALRWYVNYACRDDYGAGLDRVSAWAGLHYFAARNGVAANAPSHAVLTWPEGNGWWVDRFRSVVGDRVRTRSAVWRVEPVESGVRIEVWDAARGEATAYRADRAIMAVPRFVAARIYPSCAVVEGGPSCVPWMVANLTLDRLPTGRGAPLAWDNVIYDSPSLGYVVATHQHLHPVPRATVLTYYQPLDVKESTVERQEALKRTYPEWCDRILSDLSPVHPDLRVNLRHLDVMIWGHGMSTPTPGFMWGKARAAMQSPHGPVLFAHSDQSGISIFEEACTRGIQAADAAMSGLGGGI